MYIYTAQHFILYIIIFILPSNTTGLNTHVLVTGKGTGDPEEVLQLGLLIQTQRPLSRGCLYVFTCVAYVDISCWNEWMMRCK